MKVLKFLTLSAMTLVTTATFAKVTPPKMNEECATTSPAMRVIAKNYLELQKEQRKQRIVARKARIAARAEKRELASKKNMIKNLPAEVDTLNAPTYAFLFVLYPDAKNPRLVNAVRNKMDAIKAEKGPRATAEAQLRKAEYIHALDQMFFKVNQDAKHWEIDQYGQMQVIKAAHPDVREVFKQSEKQQAVPQTQEPGVRKFAKRKADWNKKISAAA